MRTLGIGIAIGLGITGCLHASLTAEAAQKSNNSLQGDRATTMTAIALAQSKKKKVVKLKGGKPQGDRPRPLEQGLRTRCES
jgi:hypothetical protein